PYPSRGTYDTLTDGRARICRALGEPPSVVKCHRPCRKCPSTALTRGSPRAVTVARLSTHMPLRSATSCSADSRRSSCMMLVRWSDARAELASRSSGRADSSAGVSSMDASLPSLSDECRQYEVGDRRARQQRVEAIHDAAVSGQQLAHVLEPEVALD